MRVCIQALFTNRHTKEEGGVCIEYAGISYGRAWNGKVENIIPSPTLQHTCPPYFSLVSRIIVMALERKVVRG